MTGINLDHAVICGELECKTIFHYSQKQCPRCTSEHWIYLTRYLNPQYQCSWCKRYYGEAEITGSNGICPKCYDLQIEALNRSEDRLTELARGKRWDS